MKIGEENEYVEFKKSTSEIKEGCESISSILNKHRRGTLYFGVLDSGEIVGQDIGKETKKDIVNRIVQNLSPLPYFEIKSSSTPEGLHFIEIPFSGSNVPYSSQGKFFIRFDDEDRLMDREMLKRYFLEEITDYSRWEKSDSKKTISSIDEKELRGFYENAKSKNRISIDYTNASFFLSKLGLLLPSGNLTTAGYFLFSSEKPIVFKLVSYASDTRLTISDMRQYGGNIFECINEGIKFISEHIDWKVVFDGTPERRNVPEIPMEAVREIVVNAFAHGKYESNTSFEIEVYRDRVTIYSPGPFPAGAKPEEFAYDHREPISMNPRIVDILYKSGQIESLASGFERTFSYCKKEMVKTEYFESAEGFRFTFFRSHQGHVPDKPNKRQEELLAFLRKEKTLTIESLAKKLSVSSKTIKRDIQKMKQMGLLKRQGSDSDGFWEVQ